MRTSFHFDKLNLSVKGPINNYGLEIHKSYSGRNYNTKLYEASTDRSTKEQIIYVSTSGLEIL